MLRPLIDGKSSTPRDRQKKPNIPKLDKRPPLDGAIDFGQIPKAEIHQLLVFLFPQPAHKVLAGQWLPEPVRRQPVFGEAKVEERGDGDLRGSELLLLFLQVGPADKADGAFVTESGEELEHRRGDALNWNAKKVLAFGSGFCV